MTGLLKLKIQAWVDNGFKRSTVNMVDKWFQAAQFPNVENWLSEGSFSGRWEK